MGHPTATLQRRSVTRPARLTGHALLSGEPVTVTVRPAEAGAGIVFRHVPTGTDIPAAPEYAAEVPNSTSLHLGEARMDFIEHLMAVLAANRVTDAVVEVDGGEVPLLDGSAAPYQALIEEAGPTDLGEAVAPIVVREAICVAGSGKAILALPGSTQFWYLLDHPHPHIGRQAACYDPDPDDFAKAVAPARTFATEEEAAALIAARGLQGADASMAIVARADGLSAPEPFANSFAMHKVVDLIGDLYLLGRPLVGRVIAHRTGHTDNRALARKIAETLGPC